MLQIGKQYKLEKIQMVQEFMFIINIYLQKGAKKKCFEADDLQKKIIYFSMFAG